ncbi:MAG: chemotaxis protein CheW, partial [Rhodospirillales bacterium]|nr:chemotaxis protein CheW [Rhodospirillales bacterium]
GIPILKIQDILIPDAIYPVPLSPFQVAGSINQRGRVVTLIDAWKRLGIRAPKSKQNNKKVCVIFMHESEIYGILVDKVGDVMELDKSLFENTPHTLKPEWKEVCVGVYRTEQALLLELDMEKFVKLEPGGDEIRN